MTDPNYKPSYTTPERERGKCSYNCAFLKREADPKGWDVCEQTGESVFPGKTDCIPYKSDVAKGWVDPITYPEDETATPKWRLVLEVELDFDDEAIVQRAIEDRVNSGEWIEICKVLSVEKVTQSHD